MKAKSSIVLFLLALTAVTSADTLVSVIETSSTQKECCKKKCASCKKHGGGAGGINLAFIWLDMGDIKSVLANDEVDYLEDRSFNFENNNMMMIGGIGYGGFKNGARIGGGGWFGHKRYRSDTFTPDSVILARWDLDSTVNSAAVYMDVMVAYGGFIFEQGFSLGPLNLHIGGLLGGGAVILHKDIREYQSGSAFGDISSSTEDSDTLSDEEMKKELSRFTAAPVTALDIHAGITWTMLPWLHFGFDYQNLLLYSESGFMMKTEPVEMWNHGFRVRLMFGNLG